MDRVVWSVRSFILFAVSLQMLAVLTAAAPSANLIPSLPGQPNVNFSQYSGYITVNQSHGRKLFYYFVESVNTSTAVPLVLWLNGGPGCSSLEGAFSELGPFYPTKDGDGLIVNEYSWNKVANVIFLESPAGVGFSYSNVTADYITGDNKTAHDALAFLLGWLVEYPEYKSRDFYITGESYAGHYVPQLASVILENNKLVGPASQIQLKGIKVGNPLFDATIDLVYAPMEYSWSHGMVSEDSHNAVLQYCNFSSSSTGAACSRALRIASSEIGGDYLNPYDVLEDVCLKSGGQAHRLKALAAFQRSSEGQNFTVDTCSSVDLTKYLNRADVEMSLHTEVKKWSLCDNEVSYADSDLGIEIAPVLANLLHNSSLRVWVYSGDADVVVPLIGTRKLINSLAKSLAMKITSDYQQWFQDCQIGGWSISWGSLVFATVRGAGHMVPQTQPARSLQLFTSFLAGDSSPPTNTSSCPLPESPI